jgi:hypothetical protein
MVSGPEPINMLVEKAVDGRLHIPEFQRGFVWRPDQVKALVDSLFRNYPIGEILLWRNKAYVSPRTTLNGLLDVSWIVDGQQRTTALCLLFKRKPYWYETADWNNRVQKIEVYFNVIPQGGVYNFSLKSKSIENKPEWVQVSNILNLDKGDLAPKARGIAKQMGNADSDALFTQIFNSLQQLHSLTEKTVYEQEIAHSPEDVAEIFGRLNSAGTKVKEADIFIALMAARNPDWVRTRFLPFIDGLEDDGYELEPGIFVRTMTGILVGKADLEEAKEFWSLDLSESWEKTEDVMTAVIQNLVQKGVLNSDILPSKNALIPLFILRGKFGTKMNFDHAFYWFLLASRDGRYGGSSNTILTADAQLILKSSGADEAIKSLVGELGTTDTFEPIDFMTPYNKDKFLAMLTYLTIFQKNAMDWLDQAHRIGYDKSEAVLNRGYKPEWNHFFPKGKRVLKAAGNDFSDEEINALANITVITEKANRTISSNPPDVYIKKLKIPSEFLDQQMIPKGIPLETSKYRDFLKERSVLLANAANDYLKALKP